VQNRPTLAGVEILMQYIFGCRTELRLIAAISPWRALYTSTHSGSAGILTTQLIPSKHKPTYQASTYSGFESHSLRQLHLTKHSLPARQRAKNFNKHRY